MLKDKISFKEFNNSKFTEFSQTTKAEAIVACIQSFIDMKRDTTKAEELVKQYFTTDNLNYRIAFTLSTMDRLVTIQSAIGAVAKNMLGRVRDAKKVSEANQVASELVVYLSDIYSDKDIPSILKVYTTANGFIKLQNTIHDDSLGEKEFYPLPNDKPTKINRPLGRYDWKSTYTKPVEKLNKLALTILNLPEEEPAKGTEEWVKWAIRQELYPELANKEFFFNWHQDHRGRMYAGGYHVNCQGNEYEKNTVVFAKSEKVTFQGLCQIKYAIARAFGKDKISDIAKLQWFEANRDNLNPSLAKEPTTAKAQLHSLYLAETTGYTNIPVELDATNSQLQIVSVLTGCKQTAKTCNVYTEGADKIEDAYKILADYMSEISGLKFDRSQIKKSMMIDGYGAGEKLVRTQLMEDLKESFTEECPEYFYNAQMLMSPTVQSLKTLFMSLWDSNRTRYQWTLPNGFKTDHRPMESITIEVTPFNMFPIQLIVNVSRETSKTTSLGVSVIHSVDGYVASEMVVRPKFSVLPIHDGFRCHPNNARQMLHIYNEILGDIAESDLLDSIVSEITGKSVSGLCTKEFSKEDVITSRYAIS